MRFKKQVLAAALIACAPSAFALQADQECKTDVSGNRVCTTTTTPMMKSTTATTASTVQFLASTPCGASLDAASSGASFISWP